MRQLDPEGGQDSTKRCPDVSAISKKINQLASIKVT